MPISIVCNGCGAKLKAPDSTAGKQLRCPKCGEPLDVGTSNVLPKRKPIPPQTAQSNAESQPTDHNIDEAVTVRHAGLSYVNSTLLPGEQIIYVADLHWMMIVFGILLIPVFFVGLFILIRKWTTEMAVTNQWVIYKVGLIARKTLEMNLNKVENIQCLVSPIVARISRYN